MAGAPALDGLSSFPIRTDDGALLIKLEPYSPESCLVRTDVQLLRVAIIGGGAAGAAAAAALLQNGFNGTVTTFAAESQAPYDQACLSKFVPAGEMAPEEVPPLLPEHAISDPRLRIEHVEVKQRDVVTKVATLGDGREEAFDSVLVASGSIAQRPDIPGANLDGVFTLWEFGDAAGSLQSLEPADHAIMLGDSSIGLETAAAVRNCGIEVTVAAPGERYQTRLRRLIQHCTMKATIFYVWQ